MKRGYLRERERGRRGGRRTNKAAGGSCVRARTPLRSSLPAQAMDDGKEAASVCDRDTERERERAMCRRKAAQVAEEEEVEEGLLMASAQEAMEGGAPAKY